MRAVAQRVSRARVFVEDEVVGEIGRGVLAYIGVGPDDDSSDVEYMANKLIHLRIFEGDDGRMMRSLLDVGGATLLVSQFTLWGDVRRGRRPSFDGAAPPELGRALYDALTTTLVRVGVHVATGRFGAHMKIDALVDGPVTILIDSRKLF